MGLLYLKSDTEVFICVYISTDSIVVPDLVVYTNFPYAKMRNKYKLL